MHTGMQKIFLHRADASAYILFDRRRSKRAGFCA